jgi:hypothetical protein
MSARDTPMRPDALVNSTTSPRQVLPALDEVQLAVLNGVGAVGDLVGLILREAHITLARGLRNGPGVPLMPCPARVTSMAPFWMPLLT